MTMDLFDVAAADLASRAEALFHELDGLPLEAQVKTINRIRGALHRHSPFAAEPVDCVLWVPATAVQANDYNPNSVAPPEMRLLQHSIEVDGYTQPIVAYGEGDQYVVVDGFHRSRVGKEARRIRDRIKGYLPVTVIRSDRVGLKDRMAATIRHNRARGVHGVMPMTDLVANLIQQGWADSEICKELGMEPDEVLRFKQNSGLPALFRNHSYGRAWE